MDARLGTSNSSVLRSVHIGSEITWLPYSVCARALSPDLKKIILPT